MGREGEGKERGGRGEKERRVWKAELVHYLRKVGIVLKGLTQL